MGKGTEMNDYNEDAVHLYNDDCFKILDEMPERSVDCIITDPPYDSPNIHGGSELANKPIYKDNFFRSINESYDIERFLDLCDWVCKKVNAYIFCNNSQISTIMTWGESHGYITTLLVWNKYNSIPFANGVWRQDAEFIVHIREEGAIFNNVNAEVKRKVKRYPLLSNKIHPAQKPLALIDDFVRIGTNEGDIVCDPFMGSGTTGVSCLRLGRKFIGIEKDKDFFEIAKQRINDTEKDKQTEMNMIWEA